LDLDDFHANSNNNNNNSQSTSYANLIPAASSLREINHSNSTEKKKSKVGNWIEPEIVFNDTHVEELRRTDLIQERKLTQKTNINQISGVLLNPGHPESERSYFLDTELAKVIKPHQLQALRWLWLNLVILSTPSGFGSGCLLALEMGLGKTLTSISLIYTFLKEKIGKRVLVVLPSTLLNNWDNEFTKWLPSSVRKRKKN